MIEGTYEQFAPYWDANLAVQSEPIQGQLIYLDEKEFPRAKDARPGGFYRQLLRGESKKLGLLAVPGSDKVGERLLFAGTPAPQGVMRDQKPCYQGRQPLDSNCAFTFFMSANSYMSEGVNSCLADFKAVLLISRLNTIAFSVARPSLVQESFAIS